MVEERYIFEGPNRVWRALETSILNIGWSVHGIHKALDDSLPYWHFCKSCNRQTPICSFRTCIYSQGLRPLEPPERQPEQPKASCWDNLISLGIFVLWIPVPDSRPKTWWIEGQLQNVCLSWMNGKNLHLLAPSCLAWRRIKDTKGSEWWHTCNIYIWRKTHLMVSHIRYSTCCQVF